MTSVSHPGSTSTLYTETLYPDENLRHDEGPGDSGLLAAALVNLFGPLNAEELGEVAELAHWIHLDREEQLFSQGDPGETFYIVLGGRLGVVHEDEQGQSYLLDEVTRGECLGEVALLTDLRRTSSVHAVRSSRLAGFSREAFSQLAGRFPIFLLNVCRILASRLSRKVPVVERATEDAVRSGARRPFHQVRTISMVPFDAAARRHMLSHVAQQLSTELTKLGSTLHLNRGILAEDHGADDVTVELAPSGTWLSAWLDEQELRYRYVLLEGDRRYSTWTTRCLSQADQVLIVATPESLANASNGAGDSQESILGTLSKNVLERSAVMIVHDEENPEPKATGDLLRAIGLDQHFHVRRHLRRHLRRQDSNDYARVARFLTGRAVGLTLGGGGARGFAHIGVLKALAEAGRPIDTLGGTSMGAFFAALAARGTEPIEMIGIVRSILARRPTRALTWPFFGLVDSERASQVIVDVFGDMGFQDLWRSCFAVSSNLSTAQLNVHWKGSVSRGIRASMSVPGVFTPLSDGTDLLVDGGVLDNLPSGIMRELCGGRVISVDVSPSQDLRVPESGLPSPWKLMTQKISPLKNAEKVPNVLEILVRSGTLSSIRSASQSRRAVDLYLHPPLENFGLFDFDRLEELVEIGYRDTMEQLEKGDHQCWDG